MEWRPSLYRESGFAQAVASVREDHLLCAMIDWDREVSPELRRLGAAVAAAAVAACDGDLGAFPARFLEDLHARLAALASRAGTPVPAEDHDQLSRVVAKVAGPIGDPLAIETREIRGARAHRVALLFPAAHRYQDPDLDRWTAARAPLFAAFPLDGVADAARFDFKIL
jgi:hypothetical protein